MLTAAGVTSGLDLALWIVEGELGADAAERLAQGVEYERRPSVYRRGEAPVGGA